MNRRNFVAASITAAGAASLTNAAQYTGKGEKQEFYELRLYHQLNGTKKKVLNDYLTDAFIPAVNRTGIKNIGAFTVLYGPNKPSLYVLIPHPTIESFLGLADRLAADDEYKKKAASFMDLPMSDPGYIRRETSLLRAFSHQPKLAIPKQTAEKKNRIFELRIYESHNEKFAKKKIEMFNKAGEIKIFWDSGMYPVLFAETLCGPQMPNLHYLLAFDDMAARDKGWESFRNHPDWLTLRAKLEYTDTVSNINDIILQPAPFSQL
jgi:hypothetical protein